MKTQQRKVSVQVGGASYDVIVEPGLLGTVGPLVHSISPAHKVGLVTDTHVESLALSTVGQALEAAGFEVVAFTIPAGERNKNISMLLPIYDAFLLANIERSTPILALGGGVVCDMAGFVAATILRGVPLVHIPTTLLAMVDASIGGKTGVDHAMGKNLIGAFYQPSAVLIDPQVLRSLPEVEFRNGLAECIKHDLIRDAEGFARLEKQIDRIHQLDMPTLSELIAHNVAIKAGVVQADPLEKGVRAHLNFGHTFGHAFELVSNFSLPHGQAVALGMTAASYVSQKLGLIDEVTRQRIVYLIHSAGLPTKNAQFDSDRVLEAMQSDKKIKSGRLRFILLEKIGQATIRDDVPMTLVAEAISSLHSKP